MKLKAVLTLLLTLVPSFALVSCDTTQLATPDEQARLGELDAELAAKEAIAKTIQDTFEAKFKEAVQLNLDLAQTTSPEARAEIEAKLNTVRAELDELTLQSDATIESLSRLGAEAAGIEDAIAKRNATILGTTVSAVDPKTGALVLAVGTIFGRLFFKRSRQHIARSATYLAKLSVRDALLSLAKAYGLSHTSESHEELLNRAIQAAYNAEDEAAIAALKAARSSIAQPT